MSGIGQLEIFVMSRGQEVLTAAVVIKRRADLFSSEGLLLQRGIKLVEPPAAATAPGDHIICQNDKKHAGLFCTSSVPLQVPTGHLANVACYPD